MNTATLRGVPLAEPLSPVRIPLPLAALSHSRNLLYRSLPLEWSLALAVATARLELASRPDRRRQLLRVLESIHPAGLDERTARRQTLLGRALRKVGVHTYAPVFRRSRRWLLRKFRPEGLEHLSAAQASGTGAIIIGAHAGAHGWTGAILRQLGYPLHLGQRRTASADTYLLLRKEGRLADVLPYPGAEEGGAHMKRLYDMLRRGAWLQHVGDFPGRGSGIYGTYMGRRVQCASTPWVLARMAHVPVIPVLLVADERLRCRLHVGPPIHLEPSASVREGLEEPQQVFFDFVGSCIRTAPWNVSLNHWQKLVPEVSTGGRLLWG